MIQFLLKSKLSDFSLLFIIVNDINKLTLTMCHCVIANKVKQSQEIATPACPAFAEAASRRQA